MTKPDILCNSIAVLKELEDYFCKTYHSTGDHSTGFPGDSDCNRCPMTNPPPCAINSVLAGIRIDNIEKGR